MFTWERLVKQGWSGYAARIHVVIDEEEGGNVSAAARRIGKSQRGLQKIYVGDTDVPGADFVHAIATTYGRDVTWLLTGQESAEFLAQQQLVLSKANRIAARILLSVAVGLDEEVMRVADADPEPIADTSDAIRQLAEKMAGTHRPHSKTSKKRKRA